MICSINISIHPWTGPTWIWRSKRLSMAYFDIICTNCDSLCNYYRSFIPGKGNAWHSWNLPEWQRFHQTFGFKIIESSRSFTFMMCSINMGIHLLRWSYYFESLNFSISSIDEAVRWSSGFPTAYSLIEFEESSNLAWPTLTSPAQDCDSLWSYRRTSTPLTLRAPTLPNYSSPNH